MQSSMVRISDAGEKGRGLFACGLLSAGQVIIKEYPLCADSNELLEAKVLQQFDEYAHLCSDKPETAVPRERVTGIVRSNCFVTPDDEILLFKHISYINHSCNPNASVIMCEQGLAKVVLACDIAPDEEITFCYSSNVIFQSMRQQLLEERWGFVCGCGRCSMSLSPQEEAHWALLEKGACAAAANKPRLPTPNLELIDLLYEIWQSCQTRLPLLFENIQFYHDLLYFMGPEAMSLERFDSMPVNFYHRIQLAGEDT